MIKITINEIDYESPKRLDELSISQYIKLIELELADSMQFINEFVGIPLDVLRDIPMEELDNLSIGYRTLIEQMHGLSEELEDIDKGKSLKYIRVNGKKWKVPQKIDNLIIGRWIDLNSKMAEYEGSEIEFLPSMMAILLQKDYDPKKIAELEGYFSDVDCMTALRLNAFFFAKSDKYAYVSNLYFPQSLHQNKLLQERISSIQGGQIPTFFSALQKNYPS